MKIFFWILGGLRRDDSDTCVADFWIEFWISFELLPIIFLSVNSQNKSHIQNKQKIYTRPFRYYPQIAPY